MRAARQQRTHCASDFAASMNNFQRQRQQQLFHGIQCKHQNAIRSYWVGILTVWLFVSLCVNNVVFMLVAATYKVSRICSIRSKCRFFVASLLAYIDDGTCSIDRC